MNGEDDLWWWVTRILLIGDYLSLGIAVQIGSRRSIRSRLGLMRMVCR